MTTQRDDSFQTDPSIDESVKSLRSVQERTNEEAEELLTYVRKRFPKAAAKVAKKA